MWIRISEDLETDEHEIVNLEFVLYLRRENLDHKGQNTPVISFRTSVTNVYWPFQSSRKRDTEYERIHRLIKEREEYGKNS